MESFWNISLFAIVQVFMLVGLLGLIIPVFPGLVIMWLAALGYGISAQFGWLGGVIFFFQTLFMLGGSLGDNLLIGAAAHQGGVAWRTIIGAILAGILGTFLFPPIGGLIGAPLVAILLEYNRTRDWQLSRQAVFGLAKGYGMAYVIRFVLGLLMMVGWWIWVALG